MLTYIVEDQDLSREQDIWAIGSQKMNRKVAFSNEGKLRARGDFGSVPTKLCEFIQGKRLVFPLRHLQTEADFEPWTQIL